MNQMSLFGAETNTEPDYEGQKKKTPSIPLYTIIT